MKRILTALVLVPLVLAAVFWAPIWIFSLLVGAIALLTVHEFLNIAEAGGIATSRLTAMIITALLFLAWPYLLGRGAGVPLYAQRVLVVPESVFLGLASCIACAFFSMAIMMRREELPGTLAGAAVTTFSIPYIALTLGTLVFLRDLRYGPWLLLYLFVVVWSGDIFAYYTGRAIGRHPMAPRISPKKTWEGAAASFAGSIALGALMFFFMPQITAWLGRIGALTFSAAARPPLIDGIVLSAILNIVAQTGDLVESMIKRGAGVKDSGRLLPGHGGMLDRIDALLFAAPALWYYAFLNLMFHPV